MHMYCTVANSCYVILFCRLVKVYQFWAFMDRSERHTNYPNLLRFVSLIHYLLLVFHWNACLFHLLHYERGFGMKTSTPGEGVTDPTTVKRSVTPTPPDDDLDICTSPWQHSPWSKDNYPVPGMYQFHVKN